MIAFLSGKIIAIFNNQIILRLPSGIGYLVQISPKQNFMLNETVELFVLEVHKENKREFFGFTNLQDREWVEKLLKVDGVGPKIAAQIVYFLGHEGLLQAIQNSDIKALTQVKGLGQKTAKKIILELKSSQVMLAELETNSQHSDQTITTFTETLANLGFNRRAIVEVISRLKAEQLWDEQNLNEMIKQSLKLLSKK
jgi:Holliday junction DNA helicase RuvA